MTNEHRDTVEQDRDYEAIARRAYELYEARGSQPGYHEEDWQQAERELYPEGAPPAESQPSVQ